MKLDSHGIEYLRMQITTSPSSVGTWEASFDGEATWVTGQADPGDATVTRWLLAGPLAGSPGAATIIPTSCSVKIRLQASPEVLIRDIYTNVTLT